MGSKGRVVEGKGKGKEKGREGRLPFLRMSMPVQLVAAGLYAAWGPSRGEVVPLPNGWSGSATGLVALVYSSFLNCY